MLMQIDIATHSTTDRPALSVVIITLNAARVLPDCLASVRFADEILIVDSGSTDGTQAIAEAAGARIVQKEWLGFGKQKQFAVEQAQFDWVLCLDADERVSAPLAAEIQNFICCSLCSLQPFLRALFTPWRRLPGLEHAAVPSRPCTLGGRAGT